MHHDLEWDVTMDQGLEDLRGVQQTRSKDRKPFSGCHTEVTVFAELFFDQNSRAFEANSVLRNGQVAVSSSCEQSLKLSMLGTTLYPWNMY